MDDIRKKLEDLGVGVDTWVPSEGGVRPLPPSLERQRLALLQARGLLQAQLDKDRRDVARLHEEHARRKHGGGT